MMFYELVLGLMIFVVTATAQYPQYPTQFADNPFSQPFTPQQGQQPFTPFRGPGGYQPERFPLQPPPHQFNPFEHVYNERGERLTCKMVCSPRGEDDFDGPDRKDSGENRVEKRE